MRKVKSFTLKYNSKFSDKSINLESHIEDKNEWNYYEKNGKIYCEAKLWQLIPGGNGIDHFRGVSKPRTNTEHCYSIQKLIFNEGISNIIYG